MGVDDDENDYGVIKIIMLLGIVVREKNGFVNK